MSLRFPGGVVDEFESRRTPEGGGVAISLRNPGGVVAISLLKPGGVVATSLRRPGGVDTSSRRVPGGVLTVSKENALLFSEDGTRLACSSHDARWRVLKDDGENPCLSVTGDVRKSEKPTGVPDRSHQDILLLPKGDDGTEPLCVG